MFNKQKLILIITFIIFSLWWYIWINNYLENKKEIKKQDKLKIELEKKQDELNIELKIKQNKIKIELEKKDAEIKKLDLEQIQKFINLEKSKLINKEKEIFILDKTSSFYRNWDRIEIKTQIFNNTSNEVSFKINFESDDIKVNKKEKNITIKSKSSEIINFWTNWVLNENKDLKYNIFILWDNNLFFKKIEKKLQYKEFSKIKKVFQKSEIAKNQEKQHFKIDIPENVDFDKSMVSVKFSTEDTKLNTQFAFSLGYIQNREKRFFLWWDIKEITRKFNLDNIIQYKENYIELTTYVISWNQINTNLVLETYPKNKLEIKPVFNWINLTREIFEINYNNDNKISYSKIKNWEYEIWKFYKIILTWKTNSTQNQGFILEDNIPSGFEILKLKNKEIIYSTDKISTNINTNKEIKFQYIITPKIRWTFIYPPFLIYSKYNNSDYSYNKFSTIIIK
jgi:hypothetical protein